MRCPLGGTAPARDAIHLDPRLQLGEDPLLRAAVAAQRQKLTWRERYVGDDHPEMVPVFVGFEQVQLPVPYPASVRGFR